MSYKIDGTTIFLTRGDSLSVAVGIYNSDGSEYAPVAGDSIRFALKHNMFKPGNTEFSDSSPVLTKTISTSTLLLELEPSDTSALDFGEYIYDIELTDSGGDVDTFIAASRFVITPEVH